MQSKKPGYASTAPMLTPSRISGWLTTVIGRVCLDMLRSRKSRREEPFDAHLPDPILSREVASDPEREALIADSVGLALLVVLKMLTPPERLALVLHDMFAVPFDEIAAIVECSPSSARQLARARRRVRGAAPMPDAGLSRQREVVDAFLAAVPGGDFDALLAMLGPDVVLRSDRAPGALRDIRNARAMAEQARMFSHLAESVQLYS